MKDRLPGQYQKLNSCAGNEEDGSGSSHPIYAGMLGMYVTTGLAWSWWPKPLAGLVFSIIGTEIRIATEEKLLTGRFRSYAEYHSRTKGYIPFIR